MARAGSGSGIGRSTMISKERCRRRRHLITRWTCEINGQMKINAVDTTDANTVAISNNSSSSSSCVGCNLCFINNSSVIASIDANAKTVTSVVVQGVLMTFNG